MTNNIKNVRKARGLTIDELAEKAGFSQSFVQRMESGQRNVSVKNLEKLARALDVEVGDLIKQPLVNVALIGAINTGAQVQIFESGAKMMLVPAFDGANDGTAAVEVRGDALGQFFEGWFVYFDRPRPGVAADLVGSSCVVWLASGEVFARKIIASNQPGRFTLLSSFAPPLYDVEVVRAAKIRHMQPRPS